MQTQIHSKYRSDIDGLRAIAVLLVIGFHFFPDWIPGGYIGVDIFFVISGYLISTILFENLNNGTFSFGDFYIRRILRIFPALLLVLIGCYALAWFTLLADELMQLGKHIVGGTSFLSNFFCGVKVAILIIALKQNHFFICGALELKSSFILFGRYCFGSHGNGALTF